jgi:aminotransferase
VLLNTPCNPCGKVFTEEELRAIGELAGGHAAVVVTDEIYEYILFDGHRHVSLASLEGMAGHTVTLSGLSKTYSMTGWRLGYAIAPADIAEKMGLLNDLLYICAPTPLQHAAVAAFDLPESYYAGLRDAYRAKRDLMVDACREAGIRPFLPQGTYYFLAEISGLGCTDGRAAAERLLTEVGVAVVPGSAFYPDPAGGRPPGRVCFAKETSDIQEACRRLRRLRR